MNLFYSSAVEGEMGQLLGAPHYSYRFAEANFRRMFRRFGAPLAKLVMPEYYGTAAAFPPGTLQSDALPLHLIFRSTEQIRLLKFGRNVCCFAWEFDVLKDSTLVNEHPFLNQVRMLRLCDEIWVPSQYTRDVLAAHGVGEVHRIPAPIALPDAPRPNRDAVMAALGEVPVVTFATNFLLTRPENRAACERGLTSLRAWLAEHAQGGPPTVYLAILNPEDFRKNLDALLRGFDSFARAHPDAVLIVKALVSPSRFHLLDVVADVVPAKLAPGSVFGSGNIAFMNEFLSRDDMSALYALADFYLGAPVAEGQNLPLLEAMAHGTVPVTTANTAMADYVDDDAAVVIRDQSVPNDSEHLAGCVAGKPFSIRRSTAADVYDALLRSRRLDARQREAMAAKARAAVEAGYSDEAIWRLVRERIAGLPDRIGGAGA